MRTDHQVPHSLLMATAGASATKGGKQQVFVKVSFDFDYLGEDGKRVFMREGEVLLLISKTNKDWWQVREKLLLFNCTCTVEQ